MGIVIRGRKYSCIDEACSRFNIEYDEVKQFAKRYSVDTETALLHMVGGIARDSEIDKFVDGRSLENKIQELTERRREAKPIISNKIDDWRTIARTNDSYSEGVESQAVVTLTKLMAARSFLFDLDDVQSLKWDMLDRRKKAIRGDIAEKVAKLNKEIDRLVIEVQADLENLPYSNLFMNCAKIALAGAAEELAAKRFNSFKAEVEKRSGAPVDKAKIRQQKIARELEAMEKKYKDVYDADEEAYIKKREIQERFRRKQEEERLIKEDERSRKEQEASKAKERAEKIKESALNRARKLVADIWEDREKCIKDISLSDWELICIKTLGRPVNIEEMRKLRYHALEVLKVYKDKHIEYLRRNIYKALKEGIRPETLKLAYSDKLYNSDTAVIPDNNTLILELGEIAKQNKKLLEDTRVYRDSFDEGLSMLLRDRSHRDRFKRYLAKGMNSREAVKLIFGPEEYKRIEDAYDASAVCRELGISELTVMKTVEWLASQEKDMSDHKYTGLWDIAITEVYIRNRGK